MSGLDETQPEIGPDGTLRLGPEAQGVPAQQIPLQLGPYRIVRELGRGGMGAVYEAFDVESQSRCALKTITGPLDSEALVRFRREAELLARVSHPHVGVIRSARFDHDPPFLVQELYAESLRDRLRMGPLPFDEAKQVTTKLAAALDHLHERGILHRDLKPHNVLFDERGEPRLVDFGLARDQAGDRLTRTGDILGSPKYMSPEQAYGDKVDERTDVYGLGGVLYAMLTGRAPFEAGSFNETLERIAGQPPDDPTGLRPDLPPHLRDVCLRALEKHPADRYRSAGDMAQALEAPPVSRSLLTAAGIALAVLAGAIAAATSFSPTTREVVPLPPRPAAAAEAVERPSGWAPREGASLRVAFTRAVEGERFLFAGTVILGLKPQAESEGERVIDAMILRTQLRSFPLPHDDELNPPVIYDSNHPSAAHGNRAAFNEASKALDALRAKRFRLTLGRRGRLSADAAFGQLLAEIAERLPWVGEDEAADRMVWTRGDGLRAMLQVVEALPDAITRLLRLPHGERPEPNRAAFADGELRWAIGRTQATLSQRSLEVTDSLFPADVEQILPKERTPDGKADSLSLAALRRDVWPAFGILSTHNGLHDPGMVRERDVLLLPPTALRKVPTDATPPPVAHVAQAILPVRSHPWGPWLGHAARGAPYLVFEQAGAWTRIHWGAGSAWVRTAGLSFDLAERATVRLRDTQRAFEVLGESGSASVNRNTLIGYVHPGQRFPIDGRAIRRDDHVGFTQIRFDRRLGWIDDRFLERD